MKAFVIAGISGSRTFEDRRFISDLVKSLAIQGVRVIRIGDARGVDEFVADACDAIGLQYEVEKADWNRLGKAAGPERNGRVLQGVDVLFAVYASGPRSPGTTDAINQALARGIPVHVYHEGRWETP